MGLSIQFREQKLEEVLAKNLVKAVLEEMSNETPDSVVFACRGYLRLRSVLNEFHQFYNAAQLLKHRCSIDHSAKKRTTGQCKQPTNEYPNFSVVKSGSILVIF